MARERAPIKPGWVNANLPKSFYSDKDFLKIFAFFVVYAFKPNRSSKGKQITDYGWKKEVWKNSADVSLKDVILYTADLHLKNQTVDYVTREPITEATMASTEKLDEMSSACQAAGVQHDFTRKRAVNRIAVYNSEKNIILSVFDHIRNALAHGRFKIYADGMIALESGKIDNDRFEVRARMLIKKKTLLQWISIVESGKLDQPIVDEIKNKREEAKEARKRVRVENDRRPTQ